MIWFPAGSVAPDGTIRDVARQFAGEEVGAALAQKTLAAVAPALLVAAEKAVRELDVGTEDDFAAAVDALEAVIAYARGRTPEVAP